jgi:hypothetical protein
VFTVTDVRYRVIPKPLAKKERRFIAVQMIADGYERRCHCAEFGSRRDSIIPGQNGFRNGVGVEFEWSNWSLIVQRHPHHFRG